MANMSSIRASGLGGAPATPTAERLTDLVNDPQVSLHHPATDLAVSPVELSRLLDAVAVELAELPKGARVLVECRSDVLDVVMFLHCVAAGLVMVPLDPELGSRSKAHIESEVRAQLTIGGSKRESLLDRIRALAKDPGLARRAAGRIEVSDDAALIMYTSGTTSTPKGVIFDVAQLDFLIGSLAQAIEYPIGGTVVSRLPLSFDYGLFQVLLGNIWGCTLVLCHAQTPSETVELLSRTTADVVLPLVPRMAEALIAASTRKRLELPAVVLITSTGEHLTTRTFDALRATFPRTAIQPMYGMTECKRIAVSPPTRIAPKDSRNVGWPLKGTMVRVTDSTGTPLAVGTAGEIRVSGPHLSSGYWAAPDATHMRFVEDSTGSRGRELITGDVGAMAPDGSLRVIGRADRVLKHRGHRISLHELDAVCSSHHGVDSAASVVVDDVIYAFFVGTAKPTQIIQEVSQQLGPRYLPIRAIEVLAIPEGARGKTDYSALEAVARSHRKES